MGSEGSLRTKLADIVHKPAHLAWVENAVEVGTPDCWLRCTPKVGGWVELKHSHAWPKRASTPLRCKHFTTDQRRWLIAEGLAGGCCAVLWQVGRRYYLFPWWVVGELGFVPRARFEALAVMNEPSLSWATLTKCLGKCHAANGSPPV